MLQVERRKLFGWKNQRQIESKNVSKNHFSCFFAASIHLVRSLKTVCTILAVPKKTSFFILCAFLTSMKFLHFYSIQKERNNFRERQLEGKISVSNWTKVNLIVFLLKNANFERFWENFDSCISKLKFEQERLDFKFSWLFFPITFLNSFRSRN